LTTKHKSKLISLLGICEHKCTYVRDLKNLDVDNVFVNQAFFGADWRFSWRAEWYSECGCCREFVTLANVTDFNSQLSGYFWQALGWLFKTTVILDFTSL
jgi:hypothetical protein